MDFAEMIKSYISHINEHHADEIKALIKKFGNAGNARSAESAASVVSVKNVGNKSVPSNAGEPQNARVVNIDLEGLDLAHNGGNLRVVFPQRATQENLRDTIIALCKSAVQSQEITSHKKEAQIELQKEIADFAKSFGSACIASLSPKGDVLCTYAPVIHHDGRFFIYISEVAEHFEAIKSSPKNIELMFLEDECRAKSVILRKRLRYRVEARFVVRESGEFDEIYESFIAQSGGGAIKTIRDFADFHLIELEAKSGRFVKGFGEAYRIEQGKISHISGGANSANSANVGGANGVNGGIPHKMPHKTREI